MNVLTCCNTTSIVREMESLTSHRKRAGLSGAALARASDVDPATVSRLERGLIRPRLSTALSLAAALNVSVQDIDWGASANE
ncbi:MAG: helix-turn-helix transcriptional regulator [Ferrimicrobium sp.]